MSEWKRVKLEDIAEIGSSKRIKAADYVSEGVPFYRSKEIIERHKGNNISTELFISDELFNGIKNKFGAPSTDDILLTSVGTLGVPYMVKPEDYFYFKDGNLTWFKNYSEDIYPLYLYFWLCSPVAKSAFKEVTIGSTQQALTIVALKSIEIDLPPIEEQKKIAENIKIISDKISNNTAMNATLEKIAQRIFKSWFIDFDPVKANAESVQFDGLSPEIQALFPNEFEESELGMIPKGWTASNIGKEFDVVMGQSPPGSSYNETGEGTLFFQGRRDFGFRYPAERVFTDAPKRLARAGDTLLSVRAPVGDVNKALRDCCVGRGVGALRHKSGCESFTYYASKRLRNIFDNFDGEGTVFGSINQTELKALKIIAPSNEIMKKFNEIATPLDERIKVNTEQINSLTKIRDKLLPRLISGKITIQKAEELLEEAS